MKAKNPSKGLRLSFPGPESGAAVRHAYFLRLSSVLLLFLTFPFIWILISLVHKDWSELRAYLAQGHISFTILLYMFLAAYHMRLGLQEIILDYLHQAKYKSWGFRANDLFCALTLALVLYAVLRLQMPA